MKTPRVLKSIVRLNKPRSGCRFSGVLMPVILFFIAGCASSGGNWDKPKGEAAMPKIFPAVFWNGTMPTGSFKTQTPMRITLLHTGKMLAPGQDMKAYMNTLQRRDIQRGWGDLGAHYYIDPAGMIYQSRRINIQGHILEENEVNTEGHVFIMLLGDYNLMDPSQETAEPFQKSLISLLAWLIQHHNIPREDIRGLNAFIQTDSPGKYMTRWLYSPIFDLRLRQQLKEVIPPQEKKQIEQEYRKRQKAG